MSDNENQAAAKKGTGWSDREKLVYLFALVEASSPKLDFNATPRPNGRSLIACQRMVDRLKTNLKDDLEALKSGQTINNVSGTPKTPRTPKRKTTANDGHGSPKKRGRKKKVAEEDETEALIKGDDKELNIKQEL